MNLSADSGHRSRRCSGKTIDHYPGMAILSREVSTLAGFGASIRTGDVAHTEFEIEVTITLCAQWYCWAIDWMHRLY